MKNSLATLAAATLVAFTTTSCMTTYDAYGRPVQSVDPGLAVAGIAAAGLVGYALANDDDDNDHGHYRRSNYHGGNNYYRGDYHHNHYRSRPVYRHGGYGCAPY
jgi:hypothetical protein